MHDTDALVYAQVCMCDLKNRDQKCAGVLFRFWEFAQLIWAYSCASPKDLMRDGTESSKAVRLSSVPI